MTELAVPDDVLELGCAPLGIQRHHRRAQRIQREPVKEECRPVLEQQADAMAGPHAGGDVRRLRVSTSVSDCAYE